MGRSRRGRACGERADARVQWRGCPGRWIRFPQARSGNDRVLLWRWPLEFRPWRWTLVGVPWDLPFGSLILRHAPGDVKNNRLRCHFKLLLIVFVQRMDWISASRVTCVAGTPLIENFWPEPSRN